MTLEYEDWILGNIQKCSKKLYYLFMIVFLMHLNGNLSKMQTSSSYYAEQSIVCAIRAKRYYYSQRILQCLDDSLRDTLRISYMRNSRNLRECKKVRPITRGGPAFTRSILSRGKVLSQLTSFIRKISFCGINLLSRSATPDRQFATRKKFLRTLPWKRHNTHAVCFLFRNRHHKTNRARRVLQRGFR